VDILRSLDPAQLPPGEVFSAPRAGSTVAELMQRQPPQVGPDADLEKIVQALEMSRQQRVVVVDEQRRVVGIITDGDLLRRSRRAPQSGLLQRLRGMLTTSAPAPAPLLGGGERAADLMTTPVITVSLSASLEEALGLMLRHGVKRLPVVDEAGRLQGLLGRASVLHGLLAEG
jgi:CBS domain-containing protein